MKKRTAHFSAAIMALALSHPVLAADPASQADDTPDQIAQIKARIAQLEATQKQADLHRREAERRLEAKITSDELAARAHDADHFMTAEGFTAGYADHRFVIQSGDGNFVLRPWAHLQLRDVTLLRKDQQGPAKNRSDEIDNGFEVRQLRIGVDGNAYSPNFTYFFNWATQRTSGNVNVNGATPSTTGGKVTVSNSLGGGLVLQQAWVKYKLPDSPFYLKLGQLKDPLLHEQIVDTRYQQGAERSVTADIFTNGDDYTEAATVIYDPATYLRIEAGVNHGMRSANTNFLDYPNNGSYNAFDYGIVGRVEYKFMGRWKDYLQVGAVETKEPLLVFGAGADYSERGHDGQVVAVADVMYGDQHGLSLYGEFVDRYTTHNFGYYGQTATGASITAGDPAVAGRPTNEYSIVAEAGYIIGGHLEPFGRYEFMHLQGTPAGSHNWIQAIAGGANYYFHGHRVKLTGEALWLPNGLPFDDTSNDVLTTSNGKPEISFIAQLQLVL
ncbi:MAG TPA: hypothetical protein VG326_21120 [Tepidisphaeraceae bacterium]|nr:hypothetical protein [Tepidisphaeraceae bacterium]